jgi:hypothetical protein
MKNIEFNTQICTTIEQSKRLLELGVKPETADMLHYKSASMKIWGVLATPYTEEMKRSEKYYFPAWSLHRLIAMLPDRKMAWLAAYCDSKDCSNIYNEVISLIEYMIEYCYFNKEYLKEE